MKTSFHLFLVFALSSCFLNCEKNINLNENNMEYLVVGNRKGAIAFTNNGLMIDYGIAFDDIAYILKR